MEMGSRQCLSGTSAALCPVDMCFVFVDPSVYCQSERLLLSDFFLPNIMCESEHLIMAVEKHPCLWDINNTDYHDRDIKDLAWEQISKEVYINDWETCTDKANKCAELKKKWTNIRDYYRKELQKRTNDPTGSAAKKSKKYIYDELLNFLIPVFTKTDPEGNYANENNKIKKKKKKGVPTQILNMLQQRQKTTTVSSNSVEDDDSKFLLSFRSYMKEMNTNQKIDFQMGMLQLVKKILIQTNSGSS